MAADDIKLADEATFLHRIADRVGTPFYIYEAAALRGQAAAVQSALPGVEFFYSLKANPNLSVTRILHGTGMGCEVSSRLELETAIRAGAEPGRILMVGPGKSPDELRRAVELGLKAIVVESTAEADEIDRLAAARGRVQAVALRINPDFQVSGAKLTMSGRATQFGIDQAQLSDAIRRIETMQHLRIAGLHVYMGSRILSHGTVHQNTVQILTLARQVQALLTDRLDFVDIGGGFGIAYHDGEPELDLAALAAAITPELDRFRADCPGTAIAVELGRYMVAPAGRFVTRVRQVKHSKGEGFAVCDGGSSVHTAAAGQGSFLRKNFPIALLRADPLTPAPAVGEWTLTGPLCTPMDVIGKDVAMPTPVPGDLVCIRQSGAYGPTASPVNFLGFGAPAEVMVDGAEVWIARAPVPHAAILADQTPRAITGGPVRPLPVRPDKIWSEGSPFGATCLDRLEELGPLFRQVGASLETDPDAWHDLWANPTVRALTTIGVPEDYNGFPLSHTALGINDCSYGLHVAMIERLARLDASCILALPGPSLSGGAVLKVGSHSQIERFFAPYRRGPQGTFFAVTEPDAGSDASNGAARVSLQNGQAVLNGTKMLVGGVARATIGLVFCHLEQAGRTGLVMVDVARFARHIAIERLATSGLAGADLCRVTFADLPVSTDMILGDGGPSLRDGFMSINGVFERNRPVVAAIALGAGRGILDMLRADRALFAGFEDLDLGHAALLQQLAGVVAASEGGRPRAHDISLIKMQAVAFADAVVERVYDTAPAALLANETLRRRCRDAKAFEYMEGTSNIHALGAFRSYVAGMAQ